MTTELQNPLGGGASKGESNWAKAQKGGNAWRTKRKRGRAKGRYIVGMRKKKKKKRQEKRKKPS